MQGKDLTNQRIGRLTVLSLVPIDERKNTGKRREWYCQCDCGNITQVEQRLLTCARYTKSCGCLRKIDAFLATNSVKTLTEEYLCSFDNFDKFLFIHRSITRTINLTNININKYTDYIEYFYYQLQFNQLYSFWQKQPRSSTFYDLAKPSIDHIIPKSRGGTNELNNLQFLTLFENLNKRDMTMEEWNTFKKETNTHSNYFIEEIMKGGDVNE